MGSDCRGRQPTKLGLQLKTLLIDTNLTGQWHCSDTQLFMGQRSRRPRKELIQTGDRLRSRLQWNRLMHGTPETSAHNSRRSLENGSREHRPPDCIHASDSHSECRRRISTAAHSDTNPTPRAVCVLQKSITLRYIWHSRSSIGDQGFSVQHQRQSAAHGQQSCCRILWSKLRRRGDTVTRCFRGIERCALVRWPVIQVAPRAWNAHLR